VDTDRPYRVSLVVHNFDHQEIALVVEPLGLVFNMAEGDHHRVTIQAPSSGEVEIAYRRDSISVVELPCCKIVVQDKDDTVVYDSSA